MVIFSIFFSIFNLLHVLIFMEIFWICIFINMFLLSQVLNCYFFFISGLYLLCLATVETTIGLSLVVFKGNLFNQKLDLTNKSSTVMKQKYKWFINAKVK